MICISLGNMDFENALRISRESELIEIRADLLGYSVEQYRELMKQESKVVFTCRPGTMDAGKRKELLTIAVGMGADYLDLETESVENDIEWIKKLCENSNTDLIISYHNYTETPTAEELTRILKDCFRQGADVAKIATMVREDNDMVNLFSLYRKQGRKVILGMGERGILTRVAALVLGSEFSFAAADGNEGTAPGQLKLGDMKEMMKIMKI